MNIFFKFFTIAILFCASQTNSQHNSNTPIPTKDALADAIEHVVTLLDKSIFQLDPEEGTKLYNEVISLLQQDRSAQEISYAERKAFARRIVEKLADNSTRRIHLASSVADHTVYERVLQTMLRHYFCPFASSFMQSGYAMNRDEGYQIIDNIINLLLA